MSDPTIEIQDAIDAARSITVLTGAGMSAESGIPTFRGDRNGLWARFDPMALATPEAWQADCNLVWGWYLWRMAMVRRAQPNAGHVALARLAQRKEVAIVTQNVDDLHERAGSRDVVHVHGELFASRCDVCGAHAAHDIPLEAADAPALRVAPPQCAHCTGQLRPGVVWFGEALPEEAWNAALRAVEACDLLLVIGTSGLVHPAAGLPRIAKRRGARVIEINPVESAHSEDADACLRMTAAEFAALLQP